MTYNVFSGTLNLTQSIKAVLLHAVKQHSRPATTRLRSIRAKVAHMANSGKPSHVSATSHTTNDNCVECGPPNPQ